MRIVDWVIMLVSGGVSYALGWMHGRRGAAREVREAPKPPDTSPEPIGVALDPPDDDASGRLPSTPTLPFERKEKVFDPESGKGSE